MQEWEKWIHDEHSKLINEWVDSEDSGSEDMEDEESSGSEEEDGDDDDEEMEEN